jgi:hypothetical protein
MGPININNAAGGTMTDAYDGQTVFLWHGPEDASRLTAVVAQAAVTELFNVNRELIWLNGSKPVPVNKDVLRAIIARHIVSLRLVGRGEFGLEREFYAFDFPVTADARHEPNERVLIDMIPALVDRVAKGPSEPLILSPQHEREARMRLKTGERPEQVARAYGVDVDVIGRLAR